MRGATSYRFALVSVGAISIHAPHAGRDRRAKDLRRNV